MRIFAIVALCCSALWAADISSLPQLPAQQVVARVNGVELHGDALNDYVQAVLPDFNFHGKVEPDKLNDYRRAALDRMVFHELIYEYGVRHHIVVPNSKVDAEIKLMQGRFRDVAAFQHALSRRGLTEQQLRANIRRDMLIAAVVRRDVTIPSRVSILEARTFYRTNLKRFREPATVKLSEIFIPAGPGAAEKAKELRTESVANNTTENFYQLASKNSKDDYRVMGGDRGWVHRGTLDPSLDQPAFALHAGEISQPIQGKAGFFILRAETARPERLVPFKEVCDKIRVTLNEQKKKKYTDALRARVYKGSKIERLVSF